jgi:hypothetical protein
MHPLVTTCLLTLFLTLPLTVAVAKAPQIDQVLQGTVSRIYDGDALEIDRFG